MGKIFCFINGGSPGWYNAEALSEEGHFITGHCSSSTGWAKHDMGIGSNWKHDIYQKYYPVGYELIWVDNPKDDLDLNAAYQKHLSFSEEEYKRTLNERLGDTSKNFPSVKIEYSN
jgi:hypothetical protein